MSARVSKWFWSCLGGSVIVLYGMPAHLFSCLWRQPWPKWPRSQVKEINALGTRY